MDGGVKGEMGERGLTEFEDALVDAYMSNTPIIQMADELLAIARKEFLDKACRWLRRTQPEETLPDTTIDRFRQYMEE